MFRKSFEQLMVNAVKKKPLFSIKGAHRHIPGSLFFADRAVKSTSSDPRFLCVGCNLACQTSEGAAAIALQPDTTAGLAAPDRRSAVACVRVEGSSAACIFRNGALVLQCVGDQLPQHHEFSLRQNDIFAIVSGVAAADQVARAFAEVQQLLQGEQLVRVTEELLQSPNVSSLAGRDVGGRSTKPDVDLEYVAEELLLSLHATEAAAPKQQPQAAATSMHAHVKSSNSSGNNSNIPSTVVTKIDEGSTVVVGRVLFDASKYSALPAFCSDALRRS